MLIYKYLTPSHLRKVIAAITPRIVAVETNVSNLQTTVSTMPKSCATTAEILEMCEALDLVAAVIDSDDYYVPE